MPEVRVAPRRWRVGPLHRRDAVLADDGMVIAETAIAIPVLMAVAGALIWGLSLIGLSLGMADTARQIARDVGRGISIDDAVREADVAEGQDVTVDAQGDWVTVRVAQAGATPIPFLRGLTVPLEQSVTFPKEWSW